MSAPTGHCLSSDPGTVLRVTCEHWAPASFGGTTGTIWYQRHSVQHEGVKREVSSSHPCKLPAQSVAASRRGRTYTTGSR